ncbi:hypothetical protein M3Y99_00307700 [Aphelenchoides fujianensis]|nr:hypothetical protein M3Y99_00307700 [Aphelenchoides fujianensis]
MVDSCGCKGVRYCAACKDSERVRNLQTAPDDWSKPFLNYDRFVFVNGGVFRADELTVESTTAEVAACSQKIAGDSARTPDFTINGLNFLPDFITEDEEERLVRAIDNDEWLISQSGRRKTSEFTIRILFRLLVILGLGVKCERFVGVFPTTPTSSSTVWPLLDEQKFGHYEPFELCNLEYENERQSAIELHQDDMWIWGNRLISLNLISDSVMTFESQERNALVFVPMPRRSLLFFCDDARYQWKHGIFPHHIEKRRIALTMREAGVEFQEGGELHEKFGKELLERSKRRIPKLNV